MARIASLQDGLITTAQLHAGGVRGNQVTRWVRRGHLHRLHKGVYAVGHTAISVRAWRRAALLAVGRDATLCLWSAGSQLGLSKWAPEVVHVAVSSGRVHDRTGIQVHHMRSLQPGDVALVDGLRCTTAARTLVDLAARKECRNLRRLCEQAEFLGLLDAEAIAVLVRRMGDPPGAKRLRDILGVAMLGTSEAGSKSERRVLRALLSSAVERPVLQQEFRLPHAGRVFVDLCWQELALIVEVDGPQHELPLQKAKDEVRDADLTALGWKVMRVRTRDFDADPQAEIARVLGEMSLLRA